MSKLASSLNEKLSEKIGDSKFKRMFFNTNDATGGLITSYALRRNKKDHEAADRRVASDAAEANAFAEANKPPPMPIRDSGAEEMEKRRAYAGQRRRSGRLSTILSNNSDTLG